MSRAIDANLGIGNISQARPINFAPVALARIGDTVEKSGGAQLVKIS
jgi:hypothetical protein